MHLPSVLLSFSVLHFFFFQVNSVGGISFETQVTNYQPQPFPYQGSYIFLSAFWCDIDASQNDGQIFYRETKDADLLQRLTTDILQLFGHRGLYFFEAKWAYVVTWIKVTDFEGNTQTPVSLSLNCFHFTALG